MPDGNSAIVGASWIQGGHASCYESCLCLLGTGSNGAHCDIAGLGGTFMLKEMWIPWEEDPEKTVVSCRKQIGTVGLTCRQGCVEGISERSGFGKMREQTEQRRSEAKYSSTLAKLIRE